MKINKCSLMTVLALGGLLAFSNGAMAQDDKPGGGRRGMSVEARMERLNEELKLTDEQKPKVKAVLEATGKKMQEIPREERREKMPAIREEENKKLKEIFTADQYSKYEKLRQGGPGGEKKKKRDENK